MSVNFALFAILFVTILNSCIIRCFGNEETFQMTCIEDKSEYCKKKFSGFWFIDGCNDCVCTKKTVKCNKGPCKYHVNNVDEAFDYCEKVESKNKKLYEIGLRRKQKSKYNKKHVKRPVHKRKLFQKNKSNNRWRNPKRPQKPNRNSKYKKLLRRKNHSPHKTHSRHHNKSNRLKYRRKIGKHSKISQRKMKRYHFRQPRLNRKRNHGNPDKRRVIDKLGRILTLERIKAKHYLKVKKLHQMVIQNRKMINYLKRKLLKMMRYSGIMIILQKEVADLMISNRKLKLKIKRLKLHSKHGRKHRKYRVSVRKNTRKLKKRFQKMFKNKKHQQDFLRKLMLMKKRRQKFSHQYQRYFDQMNDPSRQHHNKKFAK